MLTETIGLFTYGFDFTRDIYAAQKYYTNGDLWWMKLTLISIGLQLFVACLMCISLVVNCSKCSRNMKCLLVLLIIIGSPIGITPFILLLMAICYPDSPAARAAGGLRFLEVLCESLPLASINLQFAFQALKDGNDIDCWQIVIIGASFILIILSLTTNIVFNDVTRDNKAIFFIAGILAVTSRVIVFCLFSMVAVPLFILPLFVEWGLYLIFSCECGMPLNDPCCSGKGEAFYLSLSYPFDSFTVAGLLASTANLGFAVWGYFLDGSLPEPVAIVTVIISVLSLVFNIALTTLRPLRKIGDEWRNALLNKAGTTRRA